MRLKGKIALVTGGGSGMGRATVERFAKEGAKVIVADISGQEKEVAAALPDQVTAYNVDVSNSEAMQAMFKFAADKFGGLHILFSNAGMDGEVKSVLQNSDAHFDKILGVNLRSMLLGLKYGGGLIAASGGGSIINTSSTSAIRAVPNLTAYAGTKAAVMGLTRTAAVELAPKNIRVNAILPGPIDTPMLRHTVGGEAGLVQMRAIVPSGRLGRPDEIASVAAFLASDDASFVSGVSIPVDGAQSC